MDRLYIRNTYTIDSWGFLMINELEKAYNYYSKIIIIYACRISDEEKELVAIAQGLHICVTCELYIGIKSYIQLK